MEVLLRHGWLLLLIVSGTKESLATVGLRRLPRGRTINIHNFAKESMIKDGKTSQVPPNLRNYHDAVDAETEEIEAELFDWIFKKKDASNSFHFDAFSTSSLTERPTILEDTETTKISVTEGQIQSSSPTFRMKATATPTNSPTQTPTQEQEPSSFPSLLVEDTAMPTNSPTHASFTYQDTDTSIKSPVSETVVPTSSPSTTTSTPSSKPTPQLSSTFYATETRHTIPPRSSEKPSAPVMPITQTENPTNELSETSEPTWRPTTQIPSPSTISASSVPAPTDLHPKVGGRPVSAPPTVEEETVAPPAATSAESDASTGWPISRGTPLPSAVTSVPGSPVSVSSPDRPFLNLSPTSSVNPSTQSPVLTVLDAFPSTTTRTPSGLEGTSSLSHEITIVPEENTTSPAISASNTFAPSVSSTVQTNSHLTTGSAYPTSVALPQGGGLDLIGTSLTTAPRNSSANAVASPTSPTVANLTRAENIFKKCGMTDEQRSASILSVVALLSDESLLQDKKTHQHMSLTWIEASDEQILCPGEDNDDRILQRYTAALIYFSLNGPNWYNCRAEAHGPGLCANGERWLDASDECNWGGLICDSTEEGTEGGNTITEISLSANNLAGALPVELFSLSELKGISMDHNHNIHGKIPNEIANLTKLTFINMDWNALTGNFPSAIYGMTSLEAIDLNNNKLAGTITDEIGNLVNLVLLQVENNNIGGTVPIQGLLSLPDLLVATLHGNIMSGSLMSLCMEVESRRVDNPAYLQYLMADCSSIVCPCCSRCF